MTSGIVDEETRLHFQAIPRILWTICSRQVYFSICSGDTAMPIYRLLGVTPHVVTDREHEIIIWIITLRPRQNGRHFADDIFKCIFVNENVWIPIKISLKFVPKGPINNIPALVQIMAWRRAGDKPLSEPMMVILPTHICVTRSQWVSTWIFSISVSRNCRGRIQSSAVDEVLVTFTSLLNSQCKMLVNH